MGQPCSRDVTGRRSSAACLVVPDNVHNGVENACATVGGVFFEPEGAVTTETWQYVGEGLGGYQKLQKYDYVGKGEGSFDKEAHRHDRGSKRCCVCLMLLLLLTVCLGVACIVEPDALQKAQSELSDLVYSTTQVPNAVSSREQPVASGSHPTTTADPAAATAKRGSVAAAAAAAAAAAPAVPTAAPAVALPLHPTSVSYACAVGDEGHRISRVVGSEWVAADTDKDGHVTLDELLTQKGTVAQHTLDLLMQADTDQDGSLSRGEFASVFVGLGNWDEESEAEAQKQIAGWSADKLAWCCDHEGVGCTTTTTGMLTTEPEEQLMVFPTTASPADAPYNCSDGLSTWEQDWEMGKKAWCCAVQQLGCPLTHPADETSPARTGCNTLCEFESMQASCRDRIQWAASHSHKDKSDACTLAVADVITHCPICSVCSLDESGCAGVTTTLTTTPKSHDCGQAALMSYRKDWSLEKRTFCCQATGLGCEEVQAETNNCTQDFDNWAEVWSTAKKQHCCEAEGKGCEETTTLQAAFDCETALQDEWSDPEKAWCCVNHALGCPPGVTLPPPPLNETGSQPYDCESGYENWRWGWSQPKQAWCCDHEQKGCKDDPTEAPTGLPADAPADAAAATAATVPGDATSALPPPPPVLPAPPAAPPAVDATGAAAATQAGAAATPIQPPDPTPASGITSWN